MASRTKRRKPYDPSKAHDRRATEFSVGIAAHVTPTEVDDPFEAGSKLIVMRSTRDDPLGDAHARKFIDEAQYQAGREFQRIFEAAERGPRAVDPSRPYVDGGLAPEPITEAQSAAVVVLGRIHRALGENGSAIVHEVLVHNRTMAQVAARRGMFKKVEIEYCGKRYRECLDCMAILLGFAMEKR